MGRTAGKEHAARAAGCLHLVAEAHAGTAGADERLRAHLRSELALPLLHRLDSDHAAALDEAGAIVQAYWLQLQSDAAAADRGRGKAKAKAKGRRKTDKASATSAASAPPADADEAEVNGIEPAADAAAAMSADRGAEGSAAAMIDGSSGPSGPNGPSGTNTATADLYLPYVERACTAMRSVVDELNDHASATGTQPPAQAFALTQSLRALGHLEALDPKLARLARLHWFGGLDVDAAARALGDDEADTSRRWQCVRAYVAAAAIAAPNDEGATTPRSLPDATAWSRLSSLFDSGSAMPREQHEAWLQSQREQVRPSTFEWLRDMLAADSAATADSGVERGPRLPRFSRGMRVERLPALVAGATAATSPEAGPPLALGNRTTGGGTAAAALALPPSLPASVETAGPLPAHVGVPLLGTGMQVGPWLLVGPMPASDPRVAQWRVRRVGADPGSAAERALLVPLAWRPRPGLQRWLPYLAARAAALQHPGIARIVEAGATDEGTPWIATELAEGQSIERWCRDHGLLLRERRLLMEQALEAVQYAHARRVLHAQVHPSQIIVAPDASVRWLNFGVAELLAWLDVPAAPPGRSAGPPPGEAYAAPELQARSSGLAAETALALPLSPAAIAAATTASDVYALGLVLFEVLSGASPWQPQTPGSAPRLAEGTRWRRPSDLASSLQLRMALRGDFDAIVAKATQTDPARRYAGAVDLLEDLRRAGRHGLVEAAKGGLGYEAQRLFKRHRAAGSLSLGTFFAFVAATVVMSWSAWSLLHERDDALAGWGSTEASARLLQSLLDESGRPAMTGSGSNDGAVRPWLAQAEAVARSTLKDQPARLAGVLALLAHQHLERGALAEGRNLLAEAGPHLQQVAARQEATCNEAWAQARQGDNADEAEQRLRRVAEDASVRPLTRALCLARLTDLEWRSGRERDAYRTGSLARSMWDRSPERPPQMALLLARPMSALSAGQSRFQETQAWYEWVLQQLALLKRQDSPEAIELREQWSRVLLAAGDARQAQALADANLVALTGSAEAAGTDAASALPVSLLLAAAEPRLELNQLADARARLERAMALAELRSDVTGARRARCLATVAALRAQDVPTAERLFRVAMAEVRTAGAGTAPAAVMAAAAAYDGPPARDAGAASASGSAASAAASTARGTGIAATFADDARERARIAARETDQACRVAGLELALVQGRLAQLQREAEQLLTPGEALTPQLRATVLLLRAEATVTAKANDRAFAAALSALQQAHALHPPPADGSQGAKPSFRSGQAALVLVDAYRATGELREAGTTLDYALQQLEATLPESHPWRHRAEATKAALAAQLAQAAQAAQETQAAAQPAKKP